MWASVTFSQQVPQGYIFRFNPALLYFTCQVRWQAFQELVKSWLLFEANLLLCFFFGKKNFDFSVKRTTLFIFVVVVHFMLLIQAQIYGIYLLKTNIAADVHKIPRMVTATEERTRRSPWAWLLLSNSELKDNTISQSHSKGEKNNKLPSNYFPGTYQWGACADSAAMFVHGVIHGNFLAVWTGLHTCKQIKIWTWAFAKILKWTNFPIKIQLSHE